VPNQTDRRARAATIFLRYHYTCPPPPSHRFVFDGDERVELEVQKGTNTIILHAKASSRLCVYVLWVHIHRISYSEWPLESDHLIFDPLDPLPPT
jgi:hypothetical protein